MSENGLCKIVIKWLIDNLRWIFLFYNAVFLLIGCAAIAVGIYSVVLYTRNEGVLEELTKDTILIAIIISFIAGTLTLILAAAGFVAFFKVWRPLYFLYSLGVLVVIILEFCGGVHVVVSSGQVDGYIRNIAEDIIEKYGNSTNDTLLVESMQTIFECCGIDNYTDWLRLNPRAVVNNNCMPPYCSCEAGDDNCDRVNITATDPKCSRITNVQNKGCLSLVSDSAEHVGDANGGFGIAAAIIEIPLPIMALILLIKTKSKDT